MKRQLDCSRALCLACADLGNACSEAGVRDVQFQNTQFQLDEDLRKRLDEAIVQALKSLFNKLLPFAELDKMVHARQKLKLDYDHYMRKVKINSSNKDNNNANKNNNKKRKKMDAQCPLIALLCAKLGEERKRKEKKSKTNCIYIPAYAEDKQVGKRGAREEMVRALGSRTKEGREGGRERGKKKDGRGNSTEMVADLKIYAIIVQMLGVDTHGSNRCFFKRAI